MPKPDGPQFRFFHGTAHSFKEGDEILPPSLRGSNIPPLYSETDPDAAYASTHPTQALFWADSAAATRGDRPRVYGVEPLGKVLEDLHSLSDDDVRTREGWRVLGEVPIEEIPTDNEDDE
jgi:hypothetical protein